MTPTKFDEATKKIISNCLANSGLYHRHVCFSGSGILLRPSFKAIHLKHTAFIIH